MSLDLKKHPHLRWDAATRIQTSWRAYNARIFVRRLVFNRRSEFEQFFSESDKEEATLLIQTRMRMFLARQRVKKIRCDREQLASVAKEFPYVHPDHLDAHYFLFRNHPPSDDEVLDLFDAMDPQNSGKIPRDFARAVFDRLLSGLHPGDATSAFDSAIRTTDKEITAAALYLIVLRAVAL